MFEVINDATGGVWQTVYVTPVNDGGASSNQKKLASLDKFDDMKEHWAQYDVEYMANEKLISGVSDNLFDPEAQIIRAEYVTILVRAMNYETFYGESYSDFAADSWYANYVATAKANGLLNGLPTDDGFKPEQPVTREEMALFTYNAINQLGNIDSLLTRLLCKRGYLICNNRKSSTCLSCPCRLNQCIQAKQACLPCDRIDYFNNRIHLLRILNQFIHLSGNHTTRLF